MRKSKNKVLDGVCAGLAEHFKIDPLFVRLIFVFLPSSVLIYIVCMICMESADEL